MYPLSVIILPVLNCQMKKTMYWIENTIYSGFWEYASKAVILETYNYTFQNLIKVDPLW
jgi:hypothetical protein